jgi:CPA2 family monovalent cation:H+ antiporter-2
VALGLIGLAAWQFSASGVDRLVRAFAIHQGVARAAVAAIVAGVALPFILGLFRLTRATGQALALRALPAAEPGKVDLGLAPRRAFVVAWQLAGVFLIGVPLVAVARPVLGLPIGLLLLLVLLFALGFAFWRSATNLQGHTRAGAEVIVAALGRQLGPPTDMPASEEIRPAVDPAAESLAPIYSMIPGLGEPVPHRVRSGDYADGRSLSDLDLRDATGASVLVIVRDAKANVLPEGKERLHAGDVLALAGSSHAVGQAMTLLSRGPA